MDLQALLVPQRAMAHLKILLQQLAMDLQALPATTAPPMMITKMNMIIQSLEPTMGLQTPRQLQLVMELQELKIQPHPMVHQKVNLLVLIMELQKLNLQALDMGPQLPKHKVPRKVKQPMVMLHQRLKLQVITTICKELKLHMQLQKIRSQLLGIVLQVMKLLLLVMALPVMNTMLQTVMITKKRKTNQQVIKPHLRKVMVHLRENLFSQVLAMEFPKPTL